MILAKILYQTTIFWLVQIEIIHSLQHNCNLRTEIHPGMGRKHCGKSRKCWLPASSPFPTMLSKAFFISWSLEVGIVRNRQIEHTLPNSPVLNPFPNKPWFLRVCSPSLLKTLWENEKLLVTSNFSFSHRVFYPFRELSGIFIKFENFVWKLSQFGRVQNLSFGKGLTTLKKVVFWKHCDKRNKCL